MLTAPIAKTATAPQITPNQTLRVPSPLHHKTPRLTNSVTTMNATIDKSTVAATLESDEHLVCPARVVELQHR